MPRVSVVTGGAKENDGRGARRTLMRRASRMSAVVCGCLLVVMGASIVLHDHDQKSSSSISRNSHANQLRNAALSKFSNAVKKLSHIQRKPSSLSSQSSPSYSLDTPDEILEAIVNGHIHLVGIRVDDHDQLEDSSQPKGVVSYGGGVTGEFCRLNFALHKTDPSKTPMFRDLVAASPDCNNGNTVSFDLQTAAVAARAYDDQTEQLQAHATEPENELHLLQRSKVLDLTAVVFHESRCGSTLVANMAVAAGTTDATGHGSNRVYSESAPPIYALKHVCGEEYDLCRPQVAAAVLKDVVLLMSRTDVPKEEQRVFFKIQSIGSRNIEVFQFAFPDTPWLFVYRDPVQVLMSQLAHGPKSANCVAPQRRASQHFLVTESVNRRAQQQAQETGISKRVTPRDLSPEDYCAVHLASITESAARAMRKQQQQQEQQQLVSPLGNMMIPVNYVDLPALFSDEILPALLGVEKLPSLNYERVKLVSGQYSKGRGGDARSGTFQGDSEQKEHLASVAVKQAAQYYLQDSFDALERAAVLAKQKLLDVRRTMSQ